VDEYGVVKYWPPRDYARWQYRLNVTCRTYGNQMDYAEKWLLISVHDANEREILNERVDLGRCAPIVPAISWNGPSEIEVAIYRKDPHKDTEAVGYSETPSAVAESLELQRLFQVRYKYNRQLGTFERVK